jgi:hypothetical protein
MSSINVRTYVCKLCNKNYKSKQSLWNHTNTYHKLSCKPYISQTSLPYDKSEKIVSNLSAIVSHTVFKNQDDTPEGYCCEYCGTSYSHRQSKYRHQLKCKNKSVEEDKKPEQNQKEIINLLLEQIKTQKEQLEHFKEQEKQNQEIKKTLMDLINKNCKVHPKTLQKINKQLNGDNNTINENNINNTTNTVNNNNTFNIIALGHENLADVFSKKEKMAILKYRYCSLPQLVEYAHFNDKYPQFKNILITNTQNTLAYKYDTKKKQFVAVNKDELLDDIVDERMCDINSFYEELENELDEKTKEILDKVKDKIESDPAYKELKKKDIKLIIYNNRPRLVDLATLDTHRKKVSKEAIDNLEIEV